MLEGLAKEIRWDVWDQRGEGGITFLKAARRDKFEASGLGH